MTTYNVMPRGNGRWKVEANGRVTSGGQKGHGTQQTAVNAARRRASPGDTLVIHRPDGTVRERRTVR